MAVKLLVVIVTLLMSCEAVYVYSSFWAPLFDRRILNYRVDAPFEPSDARAARKTFEEEHGYRGERLIADLGTGVGPGDHSKDTGMYGDVKFYYT